MKGDLMDLRVTIIRPDANETPQEVSIGLAQLAHLVVKRIRDSEQRFAPQQHKGLSELDERCIRIVICVSEIQDHTLQSRHDGQGPRLRHCHLEMVPTPRITLGRVND